MTMMSSGNIPPNAYQSLPQRVMRIPMRHTFSLEQKRILMKFFEQGMVGQSLMYQEKIQQCAQEAALEFDVVRNWIGNQRRKRRLEEVQRACMQSYIDNVPPGDCGPDAFPPAKLPSMSMPPRQTQMLFLPHMGKGTQHVSPQQGEASNEGASQVSETPHREMNPHAALPLSTSQPNAPHPSMAQSVQTQPHSSPRIANRGIPPFHQGQSPSGYAVGPGSIGDADGNNPQSQVNVSTSGHHQQLQHQQQQQQQQLQQAPPRSIHSSPIGSSTSPTMSGLTSGPMSQEDEISFHPTPIRGFYPGPPPTRGGGASRLLPGNAHPVHPQQRTSPPSSFNKTYPPLKMMTSPKESPEMRHHEIRRIVEQIQMSLDRLEQLGCESLLASVSTADRSAYVCGTPIALQYFSRVNKDLPMAEYIHKQVSNDLDFDDEDDGQETPEGGVSESEAGPGQDSSERPRGNSNKQNHHKDETGTGIGQPKAHRATLDGELTNEDEDDMALMEDGDGIIKAGDEVYIVSKDRMVIGTGMLYPRPHEKMAFKSSPDYAE